MPKLVQAPKIQYKCNSCSAVSEDEPENFVEQNTMPPTWTNKCAYCNSTVQCSPSALISRLINKGYQ